MAFSQHAPEYHVKANLRQTLASGSLSPYEVLSEFQSVANSLNQALSFIRALATSDKRLKPAQLQGSIFVQVQTWTATAAQTEFLFQDGLTVDPTVASVAIYANGERVDPDDVTLSADRFALSTGRTAGDVVVADIHENGDSVFAKLVSTAAALGASLIGVEDAAGNYASSNVEGALEEVYTALTALDLDLGDVAEYLKRDGSVTWTDHQNAGNKRLAHLANGTDPQDAATVSQLEAATGGSYVSKTGDTMTGTLVLTVDAVSDADAMNKRSVQALSVASFAAGSSDTTKVLAPDGAGGLQWRTEGAGVLRDYGALSSGATPGDLTDAGESSVPTPALPSACTQSHVPFAEEESNGAVITQELLRIAVGPALASAQLKIAGTLGLYVTGISYGAGSDYQLNITGGAASDSFAQLSNGSETVISYAPSAGIPLKSAGVELYSAGDIIPLGSCPPEFLLDPVTGDSLFTVSLSAFLTLHADMTLTGKLCLINAEARVDKLA